MPILKGLPKLNKTLELLQTLSAELRENLEEKREWLEDMPESSQIRENWEEHLDAVEAMLDEIDNIEPIEGIG